jgi:hypothetical protein
MAGHTELSPNDRVIAAHELGHAIALYWYDNFHSIEFGANGRLVGRNNGRAETRPKNSEPSSFAERYVVSMSGPKAGLKYAIKYGLSKSTDDALLNDFKMARYALESLGLDDSKLEHTELDPVIESLLDKYWSLVEHLIPKLINEWWVWESDIREGIRVLNLPSG